MIEEDRILIYIGTRRERMPISTFEKIQSASSERVCQEIRDFKNTCRRKTLEGSSLMEEKTLKEFMFLCFKNAVDTFRAVRHFYPRMMNEKT